MSEKTPDTTDFWPVADLVPHPDNPKKHSPEQIAKLAKLIDPRKSTFGYFSPILVQASTKYIIAGHGRRLAAIEAGLEHVAVIVKDCTDTEATAIRLADNRISSNDYDTDLIRKQMVELNAIDGLDLGDLGFSDKETEFMTLDLGQIDESSLVDDISIAVDDQKISNDQKISEIDNAKTPLGEAFGFRKITVGQSRRVKLFMNQIESETGEKGADALMSYFDVLDIG